MAVNFYTPDDIQEALKRPLIGDERPLYYFLLRRLGLSWQQWQSLDYYGQLEARGRVFDYIDLLLSDHGSSELETFTLDFNCSLFIRALRHAKPYSNLMALVAVICTRQEASLLCEHYKKGVNHTKLAKIYGFTDRRRAGEAVAKIVKNIVAALCKPGAAADHR